MRVLVVVRADMAAKANAAAKSEDVSGGERTFTVPLATPAAPSTVAAYWCSWEMPAAGKSRLRTFLANQGFTVKTQGADGAAITTDGTIAIFDGAQWTPDQVLAKVGLQRMDTTK